MKQLSLEATGIEKYRKKSRKERFLDDMESIIPWSDQARHYFCESLFWASQPNQAAKITWQLLPSAAPIRPSHSATSS